MTPKFVEISNYWRYIIHMVILTRKCMCYMNPKDGAWCHHIGLKTRLLGPIWFDGMFFRDLDFVEGFGIGRRILLGA